MTEPRMFSELTEQQRNEWLAAVRRAPAEQTARLIAERAADQAAIDADKADSRALVTDPSLTADERVERFIIDRIRHCDVSLWADDGNDIPWRPVFKPEYTHIRRCATLYVDHVTAADIHTGYCHTCAQTSYGLRFDAACTCGYRQPGLVWQSDDSQWEVDDIFAAMDKALR